MTLWRPQETLDSEGGAETIDLLSSTAVMRPSRSAVARGSSGDAAVMGPLRSAAAVGPSAVGGMDPSVGGGVEKEEPIWIPMVEWEGETSGPTTMGTDRGGRSRPMLTWAPGDDGLRRPSPTERLGAVRGRRVQSRVRLCNTRVQVRDGFWVGSCSQRV